MNNSFHNGPISGVAVSNHYVASAGYDNMVVLWDKSTNLSINKCNHDHLVNQCSFSQDQSKLITASSDKTCRIWSVPDLKLLNVINVHEDDVMQAVFNIDGSMFATCSYDSSIKVFDIEGNIKFDFQGHSGLVERISWNNLGNIIASCGTDGTIRFWNIISGKCEKIIDNLKFDVDDILHLNNDLWIAGVDDGRICVISKNSIQYINGHSSGIKCLSKFENYVVSTGYDQKCNIWSCKEDSILELIESFPLIPEVWARSVEFADEQTIIFASFGSSYIIYNRELKKWNLNGLNLSPSINALHEIQNKLFYVGDSGIVYSNREKITEVRSLCNSITSLNSRVFVAGQTGEIFDSISNKIIFNASYPINCLEYYEPNYLIFGGYNGTISILNMLDSISLSKKMRIAKSAVKGICISNEKICIGTADGTLAIIDIKTLEIKKIIKNAHASILNDVSSFENGFVTVSRDLTLRTWSFNGKSIDVYSTNFKFSIKTISSSSDGRYSALGTYGGEINFFDHREKCWLLDEVWRPTTSGISSAIWSIKSSEFIFGSYNGSIYKSQECQRLNFAI